MKNIVLIFLLCSFLIVGCKGDEPTAIALLPSNLQVEIIQTEEEPALVRIEATADNENYFSFMFEDGDQTETKEDDAQAEHSYIQSGTYAIRTRAHLTSSQYIQRIDSITITLDPTSNPSGIPLKGYSTPMSYPDYQLVWNDEFGGTALNQDDWNYELGHRGGWGNNELQYYTRENTSVADGYLTITAKQQSLGGQQYTSSRLTTQGKQSFEYGRVDIRAAMPKGQGLLPALWMLGESIATDGWPKCGEIDIMEMVGGSPGNIANKSVHGTIHWDAGHHASTGGSTTTTKKDLNTEFHVYTMVWEANSIRWLLDDRQYYAANISAAEMDEFRAKFFFIFNIAVGGNWPGSPDNTTEFPQKMHVDYIRMFQKK